MQRTEHEELRTRAAAYLNTVAEPLRAQGHQVDTAVVIQPQCAAGILEQAVSTDASLIAMATHGRSGFQRLALGSVADKVLRGKGNFFPLEPKTRRAKKPGQEQREKPLLLHPELDDPEKHLEFLTAHDRVGVVRAALAGNTPSAKGEATIDVCALDRPQLTAARSAHAKRLLVHIRNTRESMERHQANPADLNLERAYDQNVSDLLELYLAPTNPYCGMARQIARAELPGLQI